jgi:hypothetical protein
MSACLIGHAATQENGRENPGDIEVALTCPFEESRRSSGG